MGDIFRRFVADCLARIELYEREHHPRLRARKAIDGASRVSLVHAIIANLAHFVLAPPPTGRLAVRAGNPKKGAGRYNNPAFGKGVSPLLHQMHEMGMLDFRLPTVMRGEASTIAPTASFADKVRELGVAFADFGVDEREECIVLTRKVGTRDAPSTDRIDYIETPETTAMRNEVRRVNAFLARADIEFIPDGLSPIIDPHRRHLERRFVLLKADIEQQRFDRSGRLFGQAFWLNLASTRRKNIRIEGEHIADLDYSSMFTRLALAHLGALQPDGDVYAIEGLEKTYRSGVKLACNIFLFDAQRYRARWPKKEMGIGVGDDDDAKGDPQSECAKYQGRLPAGWEHPKRLRNAIIEQHAALRDAFGRSLGYRLMFTESCVMMAVLRELMGLGIVALPLHDGLMVAQSRKAEAMEVMLRVGLEVTGAMIPVEEKT